MERKLLRSKNLTLGDSAVYGLFSGMLAGIVMVVFLIGLGLGRQEEPATVLARFGPDEETNAATGALIHLAVSGVYGLMFGLVWWSVAGRWPGGRVAWLAALAYGGLLWVLAQLVLLPGSHTPLQEIPTAHFALAHGVYGLILGISMRQFLLPYLTDNEDS